ncbi:nucleotidyltransferase domain-containing protein [bacterium]|nr:MAG: nucleotidyltransferase domain-containing protein [bacterium]
MSKDIEKKLSEITNKIVKEVDPEKIILFGSYAWGNPGPDSDVDLVVVEKSKESRRERQINIRRLLFGSGIAYDVVSYTPEEIERRLAMKDFFAEKIVNKGKVLYAR